jgi:bacterioferritin-associated ferredoxin
VRCFLPPPAAAPPERLVRRSLPQAAPARWLLPEALPRALCAGPCCGSCLQPAALLFSRSARRPPCARAYAAPQGA